MSSVEIRSASKAFEGNQILKDFDISIRDGEFMVFVGPSGCGKSTALRLIAGLEEASGGSIRIGERVVDDVPAGQRNVAMVFQSYALYPHKTVAENIGYPLKIARLPKDEIARRVAEIAETLELTSFLARRPAQLSGGQRQRVALGRAIIRKPDVFLFDEPLSNLDADLRVTMRAELIRLHKRLGSTMIYVTHDQTEAMTMGDRIAIFAPLSQGVTRNLMQIGTPEQLYTRPANTFVARFLGTPKMNMVAASTVNGSLLFGKSPFASGLFHDLPPEVFAGIRPEDVRIQETGSAGLPARINLVEALGFEHVIHAETEVGELVVKSTDKRARPKSGDRILLTGEFADLHFFDRSTGERLN